MTITATALDATGPKYPPDPAWPPVVPQLGLDLLAVLNDFRRGKGLQPCAILSTLQAAAEFHSRSMAFFGYLAHDDQQPPRDPATGQLTAWRDFYARIVDNGYTGACAENAAYAFTDAASVFAAFISAGPGEGHYDNIVGASWDSVGLACARSTSGLPFWTMDFGVRPYQGAPPTITSLSAYRGQVGDPIVVGGTYLDTTTHVYFGGNIEAGYVGPATFSSVRVTVPAGAKTGPVVVVTAGGFAASQEFTPLAGPPVTPPPVGPPPTLWTPHPGDQIRKAGTALVWTVDALVGVQLHLSHAGAKPKRPRVTRTLALATARRAWEPA